MALELELAPSNRPIRLQLLCLLAGPLSCMNALFVACLTLLARWLLIAHCVHALTLPLFPPCLLPPFGLPLARHDINHGTIESDRPLSSFDCMAYLIIQVLDSTAKAGRVVNLTLPLFRNPLVSTSLARASQVAHREKTLRECPVVCLLILRYPSTRRVAGCRVNFRTGPWWLASEGRREKTCICSSLEAEPHTLLRTLLPTPCFTYLQTQNAPLPRFCEPPGSEWMHTSAPQF